ncbi:MAG: hypothetical protein JSS83_01865 [Cyanobacteria bacterium SZAS LIN-3]|nr:hypothetical protein [Cyanobacteria bacterium SZAS LIN-3]
MNSRPGILKKQSRLFLLSALSLAIGFSTIWAPAQAVDSGEVSTLATIIPSATPLQIPLEGKDVDAFVPSGCKIFARASGDLNRDGLSDAAFIVVQKDDNPQGFADQPDSMPRAVVVVFAQPGGGYKRAAIGYGPVMSGKTATNFALSVVEISIVKGALVIKNANSASFTQAHELTFAWQHGRMELTRVSFNCCCLRDGNQHSSSEDRDLNTGLVHCAGARFFALRAPLLGGTLPVIDGKVEKGEWSGQSVHIESATVQAAYNKDDLFICALMQGSAAPRMKNCRVQLLAAGGKLIQPVESKTLIAGDKTVVECKFKMEQIPKGAVSESEFAPKRLRLTVQIVGELPGGKGPLVISTGNGLKGLGEISLCRNAAQPTLENWSWEHSDE